jgi:hypothetical protein
MAELNAEYPIFKVHPEVSSNMAESLPASDRIRSEVADEFWRIVAEKPVSEAGALRVFKLDDPDYAEVSIEMKGPKARQEDWPKADVTGRITLYDRAADSSIATRYELVDLGNDRYDLRRFFDDDRVFSEISTGIDSLNRTLNEEAVARKVKTDAEEQELGVATVSQLEAVLLLDRLQNRSEELS